MMMDSCEHAFEHVNVGFGFLAMDKDMCYLQTRDHFYDGLRVIESEPDYLTIILVHNALEEGLEKIKNLDADDFYDIFYCFELKEV